jgi:hypothetical protein
MGSDDDMKFSEGKIGNAAHGEKAPVRVSYVNGALPVSHRSLSLPL